MHRHRHAAPRALLVRGVASVEVVDGVPDEFIAANSKGGGEQDREAFEAQVRALYDQMAVLSIEPRWAKLLDFETTLPSAVEEIVRRKMPGRLPDTAYAGDRGERRSGRCMSAVG